VRSLQHNIFSRYFLYTTHKSRQHIFTSRCTISPAYFEVVLILCDGPEALRLFADVVFLDPVVLCDVFLVDDGRPLPLVLPEAGVVFLPVLCDTLLGINVCDVLLLDDVLPLLLLAADAVSLPPRNHMVLVLAVVAHEMH